jgi:hypothetical protein
MTELTSFKLEIEPAAIKVAITDERLAVDLADGRTLLMALGWYPRLKHATELERHNWRLLGQGYAIEWPDIDEHIGIEGLVAGRKSGESQASLSKWLQQRSNRPLTLLRRSGAQLPNDAPQLFWLDWWIRRMNDCVAIRADYAYVFDRDFAPFVVGRDRRSMMHKCNSLSEEAVSGFKTEVAAKAVQSPIFFSRCTQFRIADSKQRLPEPFFTFNKLLFGLA